jgi:hypothetical protein
MERHWEQANFPKGRRGKSPSDEAGVHSRNRNDDSAAFVRGGMSFRTFVFVTCPRAFKETLKTTIPLAVVSNGYCTLLAEMTPAGSKVLCGRAETRYCRLPGCANDAVFCAIGSSLEAFGNGENNRAKVTRKIAFAGRGSSQAPLHIDRVQRRAASARCKPGGLRLQVGSATAGALNH